MKQWSKASNLVLFVKNKKTAPGAGTPGAALEQLTQRINRSVNAQIIPPPGRLCKSYPGGDFFGGKEKAKEAETGQRYRDGVQASGAQIEALGSQKRRGVHRILHHQNSRP